MNMVRIDVLEELSKRNRQALHLLKTQMHLHFLISSHISKMFLCILSEQDVHLF